MGVRGTLFFKNHIFVFFEKYLFRKCKERAILNLIVSLLKFSKIKVPVNKLIYLENKTLNQKN